VAPPLRLSADALPPATAFHQLPLAMSIYKIIGRQLTYNTHSLTLQPADENGHYRIADMDPFRVVALRELPGGHPYADSYKRTDPVIRRGSSNILFRSFSAFLLDALLDQWSNGEGVCHRMVQGAFIDIDDPRYRCLLTDDITEDLGIAVDYRSGCFEIDCRRVIVSGWRRGETIAAYLWVKFATNFWVKPGVIDLWTTEGPACASFPEGYPLSMPRWRPALRRFELDTDVIDKGGRWVLAPTGEEGSPLQYQGWGLEDTDVGPLK